MALLASAAVLGLSVGAARAADGPLVQASDAYFAQAQAQLQRALAAQPNTRQAKNVILFVGDGLGTSTVTAARIFEGQQRHVDGESNVLAFEAFPHVALSKTYSSDAQVSDSAPTATAMMSGVKLRNDTTGVNASVPVGDCRAALANQVTTIAEMAEMAGMSTGAVSTARITHATPAAVYSHTPHRDWESDTDMPAEAMQEGCVDIARQLVEMKPGDGLEVAMGGGRQHFLPETAADPEDEGKKGRRKDGLDLTQKWVERYGNSGAYVWNKAQFDQLGPANVDHVLGLFERSHAEHEFDRPKDKGGEPSLAEMTAKAIDILKKNPQGFFLMVEGGRIDHASHAGNAFRTLSDTVALNEAVKTALGKVSLEDTLIVVTADHSHSLTINGYPKRGNPILGVVVNVEGKVELAADGKPYTTLAYANGPGAWATAETRPAEQAAVGAAPSVQPAAGPAAAAGDAKAQAEPNKVEARHRPDAAGVDTTDPDYIQQAAVPLASETHTGEDVPIYAAGPWSHLFQNTVEQNYIFHVMDHATRISERAVASTSGQPVKKASAN
jgi:alkaline phosphatase